MAEQKYQRLARARARGGFAVAFMSRSSLWLGGDHLLCVDSNGYAETYKRFYFRDIQAVSLQGTNRYQWRNGVVGFVALAFLVLTIATMPKTTPAQWSGSEIAGGIVLGFFTGLFILLFLINLFLGPTCKCFLRTAVQTEELPSLSRVRGARKVMGKIRPLIAAAQGGELSPESITAMMREEVQPAAAGPASVVENPDLPPRLDA